MNSSNFSDSSSSDSSSTPIQIEFSHLVVEEECAPPTTTNHQHQHQHCHHQSDLDQLLGSISSSDSINSSTLDQGLIRFNSEYDLDLNLNPTLDPFQLLNDQFLKQINHHHHPFESIHSDPHPHPNHLISSASSFSDSCFPFLSSSNHLSPNPTSDHPYDLSTLSPNNHHSYQNLLSYPPSPYPNLSSPPTQVENTPFDPTLSLTPLPSQDFTPKPSSSSSSSSSTTTTTTTFNQEQEHEHEILTSSTLNNNSSSIHLTKNPFNNLISSEIDQLIPNLINLPTLEDIGQPTKLSLILLGIPDQGAKTRVETQLKLTLLLLKGEGAKKSLDGSLTLDHDSLNNHSLARISNWSHVKIPFYSAIKRKSKKLLKTGIPPQETLFLEFTVTRATEPQTEIWCCSNCQIREQKRTQRKRDARVRPAQEIESEEGESEGPEDEAKKIVVFNCGQYLEFGTGQLTLPTRITCYCRHHREKKGFCVKITLRDHLDRVVADAITPPIMITDDHKAVAAAAKAKSGSDHESTQSRGRRHIRKLPTTTGTNMSTIAAKATSKRLKKKMADQTPPSILTSTPLDLELLNSPWSIIPDGFNLTPVTSLPSPSTLINHSKRKAANEIINQRTHNVRKTSSDRFVGSHENASTSNALEPPSLPISPTLVGPSYSLTSDGRLTLADKSQSTKSMTVAPHFPPAHHHRRKSGGQSLPSRRRATAKPTQSQVVPAPAIKQETNHGTSLFAEHIDRNLCPETIPTMAQDHHTALAAALDSLMLPARPLDLSLCSFNASSSTDLTASSSSSPDRMFGSSFESRTNTPPPPRSPGASSDLDPTRPFSSSNVLDSPSCQMMDNETTINRSIAVESNEYPAVSVSPPSTTITGLGSPMGMLGNVFTHWNMLSSFLPTATPTTTLTPLTNPVQPAHQALEPVRPRSSGRWLSNIHPILNQSSNITATVAPPSPCIQKVVPNEGPMHGGIEITILGTGFLPSHQIIFGSSSPIQTQFWSPNTLLCILPPSLSPGLCKVKVINNPSEEVKDEETGIFTYLQNTDEKLLELALQVVGLKMTGQVHDPREFAKQIMIDRSHLSILEVVKASSSTSSSSSPSSSTLNDEIENLIISLIKLIPNQEKWINKQNSSGQNLLHLAIWLKMEKLIESLIKLTYSHQPEHSSYSILKQLINCRDLNGCTVLHFASITKSSLKIFKLLIQSGIRTYIRAGGLGNKTGLEIIKEWKDKEDEELKSKVLNVFNERYIKNDTMKKGRNESSDWVSSFEEQDKEGEEESWWIENHHHHHHHLESNWIKNEGVIATGTEKFKQQQEWNISNPITEADLQPIFELNWPASNTSSSSSNNNNNNNNNDTSNTKTIDLQGWKRLVNWDLESVKKINFINRILREDQVQSNVDREHQFIELFGSSRTNIDKNNENQVEHEGKVEEMKRVKSWIDDRMMWFVWIPILVIGLVSILSWIMMTKRIIIIIPNNNSTKSLCEGMFGRRFKSGFTGWCG
ncbi:hypothetical protein CROQUDRAFT_668225 [Cronartium quercuum f. sp. fusiforme G11]|uniref:IPT/TIG domain-containing protein n=1 Tax=Cronartium quercuum f. sp. fusiforme G11 TaxID=708437 RepID=A0A9P6NVC8_9BASI|nr:hypothetical protein CROQUDRAFT_668225 [Cronartium quercuum f. sp. fusiforme G11]